MSKITESKYNKKYCFSDILTEEFLEEYKNKHPEWGFNGLGYIVYKRTYSRKINEDLTEEWWQTVARCINGAQKIGAKYTKREAEKLFDYIFNLKCNFAGRMLWQLGTATVDRFGANSLLNCWFCKLNDPKAFLFLFENLMLGGGVGFSIRREDVHELPRIKRGVEITHDLNEAGVPTKDADFIVPDSREGWIRLLEKVLDAYFVTGKGFSYSTILIRPEGETIKGFGGTASGPKILIEGIKKISSVLSSRKGKKLRSIDALDICNIIGSIVVAGNVRRSAEIAIGDPDDYLYLKAKNWSEGNIPNWRAMSNNTIYCDDFSHASEDFWAGYNGNGEPYGLFNLPLSQDYGRIKDGILSENDIYPTDVDDCEGTNPCVRGDTIIKTKDGLFKIQESVGQKVVWNGYEWSEVEVRKTGENQHCYLVVMESGKQLSCTDYHNWYVWEDGEKVKLQTKDLEVGMVTAHAEEESISFIVDDGFHDVYCFTDKKRGLGWFNGIVTAQCGEISLSNYECCNLSEMYLNNLSSKEEMIEASRLMFKTQKAICLMPFIHDETNKIVHKNLRIGMGITGVCQSLDKLDWLDEVYQSLRKFDKELSKEWGCNESIKITTVKPSGTLSLLGGSTPGVHPAFSEKYIRRVRMSSNDKLVEFCQQIGYKTEYAVNFDGSLNRDTIIVEFPCDAGQNSVLAKNVSAIKQLEIVKKIQSDWADNAVSVTVYYKMEELEEIKQWLKESYKDNIKSVSFLLHSDHGFKQAPYEEIDNETYDSIRDGIKPIELVKDISGDNLEGVECEGGACPIK